MNSALIRNMNALKRNMINVSNQMEIMSIGKDRNISNHAKELLGASEVLQTWIDGIEKDQGK